MQCMKSRQFHIARARWVRMARDERQSLMRRCVSRRPRHGMDKMRLAGRVGSVVAGCMMLSACAGGWLETGRDDDVVPLAWQARSEAQGYAFDWSLSGDREVAPLQVFSGQDSVWLQFPEGMAVPAIFVADEAGERPVPHVVQPPYVVIAGDHRRLVLRGGTLRAEAQAAPR